MIVFNGHCGGSMFDAMQQTPLKAINITLNILRIQRTLKESNLNEVEIETFCMLQVKIRMGLVSGQ